MRKPAGRERPRSVLQKKLDRLARGEAPRVLDLFSGCGGISLGFQAAGCRIEAAIEVDERAAATHALNFHGTADPEAAAHHARPRDISRTEPEEVAADLGLGPAEGAFDILVGGPPCQAYTRVGRAKLRQVAEDPRAFKTDPRANLYLRYLHYVKITQPVAILVENVPDALNYGGHNVMAEIAEAFEGLGYTARYTLINAAFHGVPQMRDRAFLIALHRDLNAAVRFPAATHHMTLPPGYGWTRSVAMKHVDLFDGSHFVPADQGTARLPGPVTCAEAIGDLPPITLHLSGGLRRGARRLDQFAPYTVKGRSLPAYARLMRSWPGFESRSGIWDHVIRTLPRDAQTFREMPPGAEYPAAHATAMAIWERRVRDTERRKRRKLTEDEREALKRAIVPPYPLGSFPNRWWKLRADGPSRTLMAHMGKDTYSHIHYDGDQARVISVREAARLQSFPDGFRFCGTMNPAYRQIGNAVPPLLAKRLAEAILKSIRDGVSVASRTSSEPVPNTFVANSRAMTAVNSTAK
ncbi:MAG: DNA cytosine methyltransferase [Pseudorhodoplanes sp.]